MRGPEAHQRLTNEKPDFVLVLLTCALPCSSMPCCLYNAVHPLVWAVYGRLSYLMLEYMGNMPYIMSWLFLGILY